MLSKYELWAQRMRYLPSSYWSGMGTKRPKIIQPIAIAPGGTPELSGSTLLKGTLHTLITGYGEIKLVLKKEIPSFWIASITPEGVMWASERKSHQHSYLPVYPQCYNNSQTKQAHRCRHTEITNYFLIVYKALQGRKSMHDTVDLAKNLWQGT